MSPNAHGAAPTRRRSNPSAPAAASASRGPLAHPRGAPGRAAHAPQSGMGSHVAPGQRARSHSGYVAELRPHPRGQICSNGIHAPARVSASALPHTDARPPGALRYRPPPAPTFFSSRSTRCMRVAVFDSACNVPCRPRTPPQIFPNPSIRLSLSQLSHLVTPHPSATPALTHGLPPYQYPQPTHSAASRPLNAHTSYPSAPIAATPLSINHLVHRATTFERPTPAHTNPYITRPLRQHTHPHTTTTNITSAGTAPVRGHATLSAFRTSFDVLVDLVSTSSKP